tara:strand:+ start:116956 stop:117723 length:768 start_codon:yes stop_codon:yes gene_type:complete
MQKRCLLVRFSTLVLLLIGFMTADATTDPQSGFYLDLGVGVAYYSQPGAGDINVVPGFQTDHYSAAHVSSGVLETELSAGYQIGMKHFWFPYINLGITFANQANANVNGNDYLEFQLPEFNNYSYQYNIKSWQLFASVKTDIVEWHGLAPYISAGLGFSQNMASGYIATPKAPIVQPGLVYANKTTANFAWRVGLGLDYHVTPLMTLYTGYEYSDLGDAYLGSAETASGSTGRGPGQHLATNVWLFGFTYTFGHY